MAEELVGNVLVGQSGGPTAVINASVAGVVAEALNHANIEEKSPAEAIRTAAPNLALVDLA